MPVKIHAVAEILGEVDGVLSGQGVGDEERLVGMGDLLDLGRLGHQLFVDMGAAGGVEQQHVIAAELRGFERAGGNGDGTVAGDDGKRRHARLLAEHAELLLRRWTPRVERGHQHFLLVASLEALGELGGRRGLARALQADQHHHHRWRRREIDPLRIRAECAHELVMHDLDDHLARRDGAHHVLADGPLLHPVGKGAHHVERDVGLEQRAPHLAHRLADIGLGQRAAPRQLVEDRAEAL